MAEHPAPAAKASPLRWARWGLLASGVALVVGVHSLGPEVQDIGRHACAGEGPEEPWPRGAWLALRSPQTLDSPHAYDAASGTTLVVPNCSHSGTDYALRVRGDHRGLRPTEMLVVRPVDAPRGATFEPVNATGADGTPIARASATTFEATESVWWLVVVAGAGCVVAAAGLALGLRAPLATQAVPVAGALLGSLAGGARVTGGYGLAEFIFLLPAAVVLGLVGGFLLTPRNPAVKALGLTLVAFAASALVVFVGFVDSFPGDPGD